MDDPRQRHGNHTWDIVIDYQSCPHCGYIMEDRNKFERHDGNWEKEIVCSRCNKKFMVAKKIQPAFGPIFKYD